MKQNHENDDGSSSSSEVKNNASSRRPLPIGDDDVEEEDNLPQHELTAIRSTKNVSYGPVVQSDDNEEKDHEERNNNNDHPNNSYKHVTMDQAVERLGMGRFQYAILFAAGLCFAADSMEVLLLSFLSVVLRAIWDLSDAQTAALTSAVFVGALVGTLVLGRLGDTLGRKPVFTLTAGIICLSGFLTAVANNYTTLLAFRTAVGFGVGGLTVPFDTLAEFVPHSHRGQHLLLIEYFWTAGTLLVPVLAWLSFGDNEGDQENDWRVFVVLCGVPCLLSCVASILYVPESPMWLVSQGRPNEALIVLRHAARINQLDPDVVFPRDTVLLPDEDEAAASHKFSDLLRPHWRKTIIFLWLTWAGFAFSYYGTIIAVTLVFSETQDVDNTTLATNATTTAFDFDYGAIFASASAEVAGTTAVVWTIDRVGRIPSQVVSYAVGGFAVFAMCVGASKESTSREFLISTGFLARMCFMSATCTTWVSTTEILSTEVRATGHASANAIARVFGAATPFVVSASTPFPVIGIVLLCFGLLNAYTSFHLPETKGRGMGTVVAAPIKETEVVVQAVRPPSAYGIV